jgi:hypothetical protein
MWPIVAGVVVIAVLILGGSKRQKERRVEDEARRIREMEEHCRRELGEEFVPGAGVPFIGEADSKTAVRR